MDKVDLSILIPARNEIFLAKTVETLLKNIRGNTEIIVGLDGEWADPPLEDDPRVKILYMSQSIGQRAITNRLCEMSQAKYVMKMDAHCSVGEGFDVKMVEAMAGHDDWTMIPRLYNLHAFDWKCKKCGNVWYQSPTPTYCHNPGENKGRNLKCDSREFEKVMVWEPREGRRNDCYAFDTTLHFQYHGEWMNKQKGDIVETMSAQGSCFMLTREKYWELNICDEEFGSWGQQGTEVALKTWLSGGRLVTNRKTWYSHMFRTQGGDFGFPFPISGKQIAHARKYSQDLFLKNRWPKQVRSIQWLIEKFNYPRDWTKEKMERMCSPMLTKGIIYYTPNDLSLKIAHAVQSRLEKISKDKNIQIVSCSLKPMAFGKNIAVNLTRGVLTMFKQILTALENSEADIIFFCEHDVLYHPSHFDFIPPDKNRFYYNVNVWKLDAKSGDALHYDCQQVSGIAVYRTTALEHYRKRVAMVEKNGFNMKMGYEPGTHHRPERVDDLTSDIWSSEYPNVDVRHSNNLSPTRWKKEEFRNQKFTKGWTEGNASSIPGWDITDFASFLGK